MRAKSPTGTRERERNVLEHCSAYGRMHLGFSSTVTRVKLAAVLGTNRNLGAARHDPPVPRPLSLLSVSREEDESVAGGSCGVSRAWIAIHL